MPSRWRACTDPAMVTRRPDVLSQVLMRFLPAGRHSQGLGSAQLEAALWVVNIATVFFTIRHLFEMNSRATRNLIWRIATAWPCATHSRTVPPSEFCARADALWTLARQAFRKGHLSLTALVRSSAR